ncbi:MAG: cytochrome b/b6 domain-containing protein [Gallionella sp.]
MMQYSKRMVMVHWLTLALLVVAWYLGDSLGDATDDSKATLAGYVVHIAVGGTVLLLTLFRLFFRCKDGVPAPIGNTAMDKLAKGIQHLLYAILLLLPISGIMTVFTSTAGKALLAGDASLLPKEHGYHHVFAHAVHEQLVNVLIALVVLHILGAIKHQFLMKDGLMKRMTLSKKD